MRNAAKVWVVELREFSEFTEGREVVYETTLHSLLLQTKGGLELDAFETFFGEYAERDAHEFAVQELRKRAKNVERLINAVQFLGGRS